ncbi:hypothetical protein [Legionella longbeachae]|uniref:hypothetical protein n=1 Tax=Legionella longbeachae TaxID=450 RepID=UPI0012483882|nr:hypothetical protein [Legionella longbeachae]QEY52699.1 hypothetical protein FQU71_16530 [Legionella longbeachae]
MPTNKFHYIWMGRMPAGKYEDSFKNGPNALAEQLKQYVMDVKERAENAPNPQDQEIIMWVPEDLIEGIKEAGLLDPSITLKPVEDLYKNAKHLSQEERENLEATVDLLGTHNAYASQKDILSAAILEEHGGFFLDTTTAIDSVEQLINNQPQDVWFPRITQEAEKMYDGEPVILPDVWAMYNPTPGDGTFKGMLNSYVQRCQFYFPEHFGGVDVDLAKTLDSNGDSKSGYSVDGEDSYGKGVEIMSNPQTRDDLIGQTAIFSFLDGLNKTKGPLTDERMRELSSFAKPAAEGKKVEELGIEKFHRGMWRNQAVADIIEERIEERIIQEPRLRAQVEVSLPSQDRPHLFKASGSGLENFKLKYQALKGDYLKTEILKSFAEKLSSISDEKVLDHFVQDFKKSTDYKVLAKGQDLTTRLFSLQTDSQKKVEELIENKKAELEEPKSSLSH